jgi:hypothetical protein
MSPSPVQHSCFSKASLRYTKILVFPKPPLSYINLIRSILKISLTLTSTHACALPTIQLVIGKDANKREFPVDPILLSSRSPIWAKAIGLDEPVPEGKIRCTAEVRAPDTSPDVFQYYIEAVVKDKIEEAPFFALNDPQEAVYLIEEVVAMAAAYMDGKTIEVLGKLVVSLGIWDADGVENLVSDWKEMMDTMSQNSETEFNEVIIAGIPTNSV